MPKNYFMASDSTQDEVNWCSLNNSRLAVVNSRYNPIIGAAITSSIVLSPFNIIMSFLFLGLGIYTYYKRKGELDYINNLAEAGA